MQELIDAGVLEETPFCRRGTRQKQFKTTAYSEETLFTRQGCQEFAIGKEYYTAFDILTKSGDIEAKAHKSIEILFTALSAPMTEVIKGEMAGYPHSSLVAERLPVVRTYLEVCLDLCERMIWADGWDDVEGAKTLFHTPPDNINAEKILEAKARLFKLADEGGW